MKMFKIIWVSVLWVLIIFYGIEVFKCYFFKKLNTSIEKVVDDNRNRK